MQEAVAKAEKRDRSPLGPDECWVGAKDAQIYIDYVVKRIFVEGSRAVMVGARGEQIQKALYIEQKLKRRFKLVRQGDRMEVGSAKDWIPCIKFVVEPNGTAKGAEP